MNLLEMMFRGGVIMWPILACAMIALYVAIERYFVLRKARLDVDEFMIKLRSLYRRGDVAGILAFCSQKNAPVANIIRRGILKHAYGSDRVKGAIESAGREEVFHLERHLSVLASLSGVAPMLGFLGTATGIIAAFHGIDLRNGGVVNPGDVASGIWGALLTTVFGLIVGIPVLAAYNYFLTRVRRFVHEMEMTSTEFIELLEGTEVKQEEAKVVRRPLVLEEDEFFRRKH